MLKNSGVKAGDRVTIYLSNSPFAIATMLACARIGAIHNVVFAGFSAEALAARINNGEELFNVQNMQGKRDDLTSFLSLKI